MSLPTKPSDYSKIVQSFKDYIDFFTNLNIDATNIQQFSTEIKQCTSLIQRADRICKPTREQERLAKWQKDLRDLILDLVLLLPDDELIAKMDSSPDNTGNPYCVQFLNA